MFQFGSTVNGLAIVGSDVDATVMMNISVAAGTVVEQAMEVLQQYPHLFTDFETFTGSIDFVSFYHIRSGFFIDVTFNYFDGVRSTELIKYLIHLDERVFDLVMIVKHWAKVHKLTRDRILSNFAMTLLVIFYLQQRDILPSIATLQSDAEPIFLEGWNTGFDKIKFKPRIEDSLYHLLGGFFDYYDAFDYDQNIISIFAGRPIKRKLFEDLFNVPDEYDLYKLNVGNGISRALILRQTEVIIQDPFTHFVNLARHLKSQSFAAFTTQFKSAALKYRGNNESVFLSEILS